MPVTTTSPNSELPKATTKGKEAAAHPEQAPALKPSPANATPPTPGTNRRILHDLATTANIPTDRLKTFQLSLIGAETMKRKDLIVGGAFFGPEGIKLGARGKKPLELDDIDPKVVKKAAKEWVQRELSEDQAKRVEKAGILKATRGKKKVATLADEKENEDLAENKDRDGVKKGRKRSSDEAENKDQQPQQQQQEEVTIDWDEEIDEYTWNCDQIRRKIKTFIENGGMKVTAFQRAIGANSNSYGRFMKLRGPWSGNSNSTFEGATRFFKAREAANLPMPKKPKLLPASAGATHDHSDITTIHLDGEDTDTVPIYDSCDEIRKKIAAHLRKPGVTQAQFLRDVAAQFKTQSVRIQGKQLADFRAKSGALAGNTSRVYYGAYVYFEKCRLKEGKDKSKHRLEMEKRWSREGGVDIKTPGNRGIWVCKGEIPIIDQYGTLNILTK